MRYHARSITNASPMDAWEEFIFEIDSFYGGICRGDTLSVGHKHVFHLLHRVFLALRHSSDQYLKISECYNVALHGKSGDSHFLQNVIECVKIDL